MSTDTPEQQLMEGISANSANNPTDDSSLIAESSLIANNNQPNQSATDKSSSTAANTESVTNPAAAVTPIPAAAIDQPVPASTPPQNSVIAAKKDLKPERAKPGRKAQWPDSQIAFLRPWADEYVKIQGSKQEFYGKFWPAWWAAFPESRDSAAADSASVNPSVEAAKLVPKSTEAELKKKIQTFFQNARVSATTSKRNPFESRLKSVLAPAASSIRRLSSERALLKHSELGPPVRKLARELWDKAGYTDNRKYANFERKVAKDEYEKLSDDVREEVEKERQRDYESRSRATSGKMKEEEADEDEGVEEEPEPVPMENSIWARRHFPATAEPLAESMGKVLDANVVITAYKMSVNPESNRPEVFFYTVSHGTVDGQKVDQFDVESFKDQYSKHLVKFAKAQFEAESAGSANNTSSNVASSDVASSNVASSSNASAPASSSLNSSVPASSGSASVAEEEPKSSQQDPSSPAGPTYYEVERQRNEKIAQNKALLESLGLGKGAGAILGFGQTKEKEKEVRKIRPRPVPVPVQPLRRSTRTSTSKSASVDSNTPEPALNTPGTPDAGPVSTPTIVPTTPTSASTSEPALTSAGDVEPTPTSAMDVDAAQTLPTNVEPIPTRPAEVELPPAPAIELDSNPTPAVTGGSPSPADLKGMEWFKTAREQLRLIPDGLPFSFSIPGPLLEAIKEWEGLEVAYGSRATPKTLKQPKGARPEVVGLWNKNHRSDAYITKLFKESTFPSSAHLAEKFPAWWFHLIPQWRREEGTQDQTGSWEPLRAPGINGLYSVLICLKWWSMQDAKEGNPKGSPQFLQSLSEFRYAVKCLTEAESSGSRGTGPSGEPNGATGTSEMSAGGRKKRQQSNGEVSKAKRRRTD